MPGLLDLIRDRPPRGARCQQRRMGPDLPQQAPSREALNPCPVNQAECGTRCFIRHACTSQPSKVAALLERLDAQTARAMAEIVLELRRA